MMPLRSTALFALALLPAVTVAVAVAQPAATPPRAAGTTPSLTTDTTTVRPGETLTLTGRGFPRNERLALLAGPPKEDGQRIGGAQTGRRGSFTAKIRIRARSDAGAFVARACFDACRVKASVRFRIVAP